MTPLTTAESVEMSRHVGFLNKLFGLCCVTIVALWHFSWGKWKNGGIVWVIFGKVLL